MCVCVRGFLDGIIQQYSAALHNSLISRVKLLWPRTVSVYEINDCLLKLISHSYALLCLHTINILQSIGFLSCRSVLLVGDSKSPPAHFIKIFTIINLDTVISQFKFGFQRSKTPVTPIKQTVSHNSDINMWILCAATLSMCEDWTILDSRLCDTAETQLKVTAMICDSGFYQSLFVLTDVNVTPLYCCINYEMVIYADCSKCKIIIEKFNSKHQLLCWTVHSKPSQAMNYFV